MGSRFRSSAGLVAVMLAACVAGCSDAVQLIRETDGSGVATYLFKEERGGPMGSPHRRGAVQLLQQKCPLGYTVIKEGEVAGYGSMSSVEGQEGEPRGRRWGIQFHCK